MREFRVSGLRGGSRAVFWDKTFRFYLKDHITRGRVSLSQAFVVSACFGRCIRTGGFGLATATVRLGDVASIARCIALRTDDITENRMSLHSHTYSVCLFHRTEEGIEGDHLALDSSASSFAGTPPKAEVHS